MSYGLENLELRQLEGLFTILNQCTDSFLFVFDLSADTYFISPYAKNLFNFPEEKLENASTNLMKIVYPEDQELPSLLAPVIQKNALSEMTFLES